MIVDASAGRTFSVGIDQVRVLSLIEGESADFAIVDYIAEPGVPGAPPHIHGNGLHEFWYVTEGELAFLMEDETVQVGAGGFVHVPPGTVHAYANRGDRPARFLAIFAPAWGLRMFEEAAAAAHPVDRGPADPAKLLEVLARYGTELVKLRHQTQAPRERS
jgi:mannose-6-phosphate isomerase-like protein (cupin superfamily)